MRFSERFGRLGPVVLIVWVFRVARNIPVVAKVPEIPGKMAMQMFACMREVIYITLVTRVTFVPVGPRGTGQTKDNNFPRTEQSNASDHQEIR